MEDCHVQPASHQTEAKLVTGTSIRDNNDKVEEEVDAATHMFPECFVSVKLEHSEEAESTVASQGKETVPSEPDIPSAVTMQNSILSPVISSANHSSTSVTNSANHCFHRTGSTNFASTMQEFPPWLTHCYATGQIADVGVQQSTQVFHQTSAYLIPDGTIVQTDRSSKMWTAASGGLANGDICDSSTFLNYVRSSGLFVFDTPKSLAPNAEIGNSQSSNMEQQSGRHKQNASPSAAVPVEGNPPRRDAATNTVAHFVPFDHNDKIATEEGDVALREVHQCARCAASRMPHTCRAEEDNSNNGKAAESVTSINTAVENNKVHTNSQVQYEGCNSCAVHHISDVSGEDVCASKCVCGGCKRDDDTGSKIRDHNVPYIDVNRPFSCEVCFKSYPTSTALVNHMRYHQGQRPYQCEICNKAFATNSHLVTHRRVHTGERPFICRLCHRSFADRSAHVKHERTHGPNGTIIRRYKCDECGNSFVDSCGLKKHMRIHTGERPYCCSVCQKTFSTSSTFVAHKRIHSGERPYKCENCEKMFITKSHLLTHRRTHTGEKPFTCSVCSRAFADGSSFRRHERLHTGENRHICDVCGKGFPFDTSLAKHKQSHIPGAPTYICRV